MTEIDNKLKNLPDKPGVYIMKDLEGRIIYVGKAISLRHRVRQYFKTSGHFGKVGAMVNNIHDFDYILTDSEVEALILECNLIKKYRPKYNILLKDDKHYPYIKVTTQEVYPRILLTRKIERDNHKYFGPYTSAKAVRETIEVVKKIFPIRTCSRNLHEGMAKERPCLNYHIRQCWGPCQGDVKSSEYRAMIKDVCRFLDGRQEDLLEAFRGRMTLAAENLQFEQAAVLRDRIAAVERILEGQKIISTDLEDQDIIAMAQGSAETAVQVFFVRGGKLISAEHFILENTADTSPEDVLESFIKQFYSLTVFIPKEILLPIDIDGLPILEEWLSDRKGNRVYIKAPKRGEKKKRVEMAARNAMEALIGHEGKIERELERTLGALTELGHHLGLEAPPMRMEAFDISNLQGTDAVASMVVFEGGKPSKKDYRRFKIKTVEGPNDFASMAEVISRRFKRGLEERTVRKEEGLDPRDGKFSRFPDLVIVDGGKGQLSAALEVMISLGLEAIPTVGLAKEFEEIHSRDSETPLRLPRNSNSLHLIQRIRDEAHRFAISYHRSLRNKGSLHSVLEDIPGVGSVRRKALIHAFGSVEAIRRATMEELTAVSGMNRKAAEQILAFLKSVN